MKKMLAPFLVLTLAVGGCAEELKVDEKTYPPYGVANKEEKKSKDVCYKTSAWNVILSIIFSETIFVPVYLVGWEINEPVRLKRGPDDTCGIDSQ